LSREERGQNHLTVFKHDPQNPNSLGSNNVRSLLVDRSGTLWVGTWADGLHQFDEQSGKFKRFVHDAGNPHSVANNFIRAIYEDCAGRLWIGTDGGLDELDRATKQFKHYTEKDGLPNNKIWGILEDDRGRLWLSTNNGISCFDPKASTNSAFKNYTVRDGLSHQEFNRGAYFKSNNGEMFFGGMNGVTAFHPDGIGDNPFVPPVVITACKRYNTDDAEGIAIVERGISARQEIKFSYKDNIISFEFAALNFRNSEQNQYAYKLEGYREQWIQLGAHREATFTNLDPGEYVLRVKGSNNDGVWNEEGASLKIIITPPWWRTWWAYALYGVIFFGLLYGLRRYETSRQQFKHRAELEHVQAEKLHELNHLKSRFFANISHEFRTPLTLIMGQVEALHSDETAESKKAKLAMAARNAQKLLTLINQLLDLSKFEAGQMTLRASQQNIVPLLKHLTATFESWAAQKKIALQFETSQDDVPVRFERDKIEKVMYNLLSNALKFTPEGGKVSVQLAVLSDQLSVISHQLPVKKLMADDCLLITIRDSGIGIPHDRLPYIFDRFYQVDSSQTREYEGTGIGLALVQELVQLHGGGISVESAVGFGTTFVISLPLGNAHLKPEQMVVSEQLSVNSDQLSVTSEQLSVFSTAQPATSGQQPASSSDFILIVEDNADMRAFIGESLQDGYRILQAANGEEGFVKAQEYLPDLIITDVMMPRVDGYEMTRRIRQDQVTCHIPIIMLTAKAAEEDKLEGLERGVDAYLTKPFNKKELQIRVRKLIELRRLLRQQTGTKAVLAPSKIEATSLDQQFLQRIQEIIEENLENEDFSVDDLAAKAGVGQRQLQRKLKALTDSSPQQCIRSMRLQRARQLLEQGAGTVSEIAFRLCYGTVAAFSEAFREEFGEPPSAVKPKKGK
jgi:signal transduction histidine kinase/DNA-binding response OmpR family regulator